MQVIKKILFLLLAMVIIITSYTACGFSIEADDANRLLSGEIDRIMSGAIEGMDFNELDLQYKGSRLADWYNHTAEQWYIKPSESESYTFKSNLEEIRVVEKSLREAELECEFSYQYTRTIKAGGYENMYEIGKGEILKAAFRVGCTGGRMVILDINPIGFS